MNYRCRTRWGVDAPRARAIAEEAAAEAFSRALGRPFPSEAAFRGWLVRTAYHYAVDLLRAEGRHHPLPEGGVNATRPDRHRFDDALNACVEKLPEYERLIIRLTIDENLTLDGIADRVRPPGDTQNARRLRIKRKRDAALGAVRACLSAAGIESSDIWADEW